MTLLPKTLVAIAGLALTALMSCNLVTLDEYPCPDGGTTLSYVNFGYHFMEEWCNSCHSAPDGARNGAPDAYVFATQADVIEYKDRIFARAADTNNSMPPGPDMIPSQQRVDLAIWLACGAR